MLLWRRSDPHGIKAENRKRYIKSDAEHATAALSDDDEESSGAEEDNLTEAEHDAATLKAREWDNWKDEHEKGLGNSKARR